MTNRVLSIIIGLIIGNLIMTRIDKYKLEATVQQKQKTIDSLLIINKYENYKNNCQHGSAHTN